MKSFAILRPLAPSSVSSRWQECPKDGPPRAPVQADGSVAPDSRWGSRAGSAKFQESGHRELPSPKSRARRRLSGHDRVNGLHSRAREKEAGGSQTGGGGAEGRLLTTPTGSVGRDRSPPTMATAVFVCPEGN